MQWNKASHCEFDEKSMGTETTTWSEYPNAGKAIAEQMLASGERNPQEQDYKMTVWDPVEKLSKVIRDRKILRVHEVNQFHQNR